MANTAQQHGVKPETQTSGAEVSADKPEDKGKFIKFNAHNGIRSISKEAWAAVGVKDQEDAVWDKTNAWRLPRSDFSDKALNYLLKVDGEFVAED